jgi:hypothetical protein
MLGLQAGSTMLGSGFKSKNLTLSRKNDVIAGKSVAHILSLLFINIGHLSSVKTDLNRAQ